jgi:hypothetical protein
VNDYLLFMHDDAPAGWTSSNDAWATYFKRLRGAGAFEGGSAIGDGVCMSKSATPGAVATHITGFVRISAENLAAARALVMGNPVYEAGGTVEIRELPRTD